MKQRMSRHHVRSDAGVSKFGFPTERRITMAIFVDWRDEAACRGTDAELFFPVGTAGPALRQIDEAKRICRTCLAQTACLAWAVDHGIAYGVWGGTTGDERRAMRRPAARK
jgi:WhiB family transcriptional regulator, redox-sensing transcriptional regulator